MRGGLRLDTLARVQYSDWLRSGCPWARGSAPETRSARTREHAPVGWRTSADGCVTLGGWVTPDPGFAN